MLPLLQGDLHVKTLGTHAGGAGVNIIEEKKRLN